MAQATETEVQEEPVAEAAETAAETTVTETEVVEEAAVETEVAAEATEVEAAEPSDPALKADWRDKRIAKLTAQLAAAKTKPVEAAPPASGVLTQADVDRKAQEIADTAVATRTFNEACNQAAAKGRTDFADFDSRLGELRRLVDPADPEIVGQYNTFLAAALETGEAPKLIHALGGDLNEASRILALPLVRMAVELTRLAGAQVANELSKAPKPLIPIASRSGPHTEIDPTDPTRSDRLSTKEWMRRMDERDAKMARH